MKRRPNELYGLEYHGVAGSSIDCQDAVMRLLQCGPPIVDARIITAESQHCLFLKNKFGDWIAVKSGFTSGYGGTGPSCFSTTLLLLESFRIPIDECEVGQDVIDRLDQSALTIADYREITKASSVRPNRWYDYVRDIHRTEEHRKQLWEAFPQIIPFAVIDERITDLARDFWDNPDGVLVRGYRRLEDIVRSRTGLTESSAKLFSTVFLQTPPKLRWRVEDESEHKGRAQLFVATYMAFRNPRAHKEAAGSEFLLELLLLNQLFRLESEAISTADK